VLYRIIDRGPLYGFEVQTQETSFWGTKWRALRCENHNGSYRNMRAPTLGKAQELLADYTAEIARKAGWKLEREEITRKQREHVDVVVYVLDA